MSTLPPPPEPEIVGQMAARRARATLEGVLLGLIAVPAPLEREGLRDRLLRAIHCTYVAQDTPVVAAAHLDALREGASMAAEVRAMLARAGDPAEVAGLGAALDELASAAAQLAAGADAVATVQLGRRAELLLGQLSTGVPAPRPFRASRGVPALHAISRLPLLPWVDVGENPPEAPQAPRLTVAQPRSLDELRAISEQAASGELPARLLAAAEQAAPAQLAAPAPAPFAFTPAIEEVELLRRLGRDCLEDIASHRSLRKPNAIESWLDQGPFEQRLLRNVDAFATLGAAALPQVSLYHAEAKSPDAERAFAVALTLGCIDGADAIGAAVLSLKQSAPETFPGWIEGFWLAPSPAVDPAMADLCEARRPELVALALDVLDLRGTTPEATLRALLPRREPLIAPRVARALATVLPRAEAERALDAALVSPDDELFFSALASSFRRGHERALPALREACAPGSPRAARACALLCLVGRASDAERLVAELFAAPTPELVRALGRFGHVDLLPRLLDLLHGEDPELIAAAAESLDRITGAGLRAIVEEPWDIELPPEAEGAGGLPVPLRKVERVVCDPAPWAAWLAEHEGRLDARKKTRGGRPFTPAQIVDELEARAAPPERREEALRELLLVTGVATTFSPNDWVARQLEQLPALRAQVAATPYSSGAWARVAQGRPVDDEPPVSLRVAPAPLSSPRPIELPEPTTLPMPPLRGDRPVLPFAPAPAAPPSPAAPPPSLPSPPSIVNLPPSKPGEISLGATSAIDPAVAAAAWAAVLPFLKSREPAPPAAPAAAPPRAAPPPAPASPVPPSPPVPPAAPPPLSLEHYAALCAELSTFPQHADLVFRRYGLLDERQRREVDLGWKEQLRRDAALHAQWQALYQRWCAHFAAQARGSGPADPKGG